MEDSNESKGEPLEKKKTNEHTLFFGILVIIVLFVVVLSTRFVVKDDTPKTVDELHEWNLEGKLDPDKGYVYNGFSFVNVDDFWYTKIDSPKGTKQFSLMFRFGPREVEDVVIKGQLNTTLFDKTPAYYVTFNPLGENFSFVAAAVNDFNQNMLKAFNKMPIAACDKNETDACKDRPIITCNTTRNMIFYVNESDSTDITFNNNCIVVNGEGVELVRAVDRLLFLLYGIM